MAAGKAKGAKLGHPVGTRPSDKKAKGARDAKDGLNYRLIGRNLGMSKNTVIAIIKRGSTQPKKFALLVSRLRCRAATVGEKLFPS